MYTTNTEVWLMESEVLRRVMQQALLWWPRPSLKSRWGKSHSVVFTHHSLDNNLSKRYINIDETIQWSLLDIDWCDLVKRVSRKPYKDPLIKPYKHQPRRVGRPMSSNLPTIEQALHIAGGGGTVGHTESNGKARRLAKE